MPKRGYARILGPIEAAYKAKFKSDTQRTLKRTNKTGHWISVMPSHVSGTILSWTYFRDAVMLRYARVPSNLPTSCDGCGESKKFDVNHGTILSSIEFRDYLKLRYARLPSNLPTSCDRCGESKKFDVNHALDCKKVGLITARHDQVVTNPEIY